MDNSETIKGGCLCGATRYRATGKPYKSSYCHCLYCRGVTASPIAAWLMFEGKQVEMIKGNLQKYASSPGVLRGFCPVCGTPLWWEGTWDNMDIQMVTTCSLDDPELYPPDRHAFCHNRLSWFDVDDDLPRYQHASPKGVIQ